MIPVEQLRAMIRLLFPDEMTPMGKRMLDKLCDQYDTPYGTVVIAPATDSLKDFKPYTGWLCNLHGAAGNIYDGSLTAHEAEQHDGQHITVTMT